MKTMRTSIEIDEKLHDDLGVCLGDCPADSPKIIERTTENFDEEAVAELLSKKRDQEVAKAADICGCASANLQSFPSLTPCQAANAPVSVTEAESVISKSSLTHWPVQIRLVPPTAPFLRNANLLIAADCTPLAYPDFHRDFLVEKVVLMGCPKFDDARSYVRKFTEIFQTADIKNITIVIMEVPCCGSMREIVKEAFVRSGKDITTKEIVVNIRGQILHQESWGKAA